MVQLRRGDPPAHLRAPIVLYEPRGAARQARLKRCVSNDQPGVTTEPIHVLPLADQRAVCMRFRSGPSSTLLPSHCHCHPLGVVAVAAVQ
jgi:hypothetical protein